jgi:Carboxypeptidase regulatory-like domain
MRRQARHALAISTFKNNQTGATQDRTVNSQGVYRFSLLDPGSYTITVNAQGFQPVDHTVQVSVGQASAVNIQLGVATAAWYKQKTEIFRQRSLRNKCSWCLIQATI